MSTNESGGLSRFIPRRIQQSYLARIAVIFVVILLVVNAVGYTQYVAAETHIKEDAHAELLEQANENVRYLMTWRGEHTKTVSLLSTAEELSEDDEMDEYLATQYARLPADIVDLSVVDLTTGEVLASTTEGTVGTTMDRVIASGTTFDSPTAVAATTKYEWSAEQGNVITFYSAVPADSTLALAYSAQTATVDALLTGGNHEDEAGEDHDGEASHITTTMLVSPEGRVDLDTAGQIEGQAYPVADFEGIEKAFAGESGVVEQPAVAGVMDEPYIVAYVPFHSGLVLLLHQPTSSAYELTNDVTQSSLAIVGTTIVGFLALGLVLSQNTVKPLRALSGKVTALREGDLDVDLQTGRKDEFGSVLAGVSALRDDLRDQRSDAERYSHVMERAATGDLTARMDADSDSHDMRVIATTYNDMMDDLEDTIASVRAFGDDVAALSEQMAGGADEVSQASEEVSRAVQQIADGAGDQNDKLLSVASNMNDMSASIEQIAASADELSNAMDRAMTKGDQGREAATEALDGIAQIQAETDSTATEMNALNDQMQQIGEIVEVITDIAEQTNILALNANIEAARAGEAGEGFAVVSHEVKSLAEKTKESAQQIEELIDALRDQQEAVLGGVDQMRARVEDGSTSVTAALASLEEIIEEVDETSGTVGEINGATSAQADSAQSIQAMADDAASISEETAAEAQNVSAAAEEQTASLTEVSTGTQELSRTAQELRDRLAQFVVSDAGRANDGVTPTQPPTHAASVPASVATDGGQGDE